MVHGIPGISDDLGTLISPKQLRSSGCDWPLGCIVSGAFGLNSDVAAEAADAVILESSLGKVDELIHIGRRMRSIALQSAVGGMALSALGMLAAAFGFLPAIDGAVAQELIDLVAVLNAVRMAVPTSKLRDI